MKVDAQGITVSLAGRRVLNAVTLTAAPGRITGLIGPNGAGKSTLLRALAGLIPLAAGHVRLGGRDVGAYDRTELGRHIAYLPQERRVHWPLSVATLVALGRLPHGAGMHAAHGTRHASIVEQAIRDMDLTAFANRSVAELSGGELARALVARALAQEASVILADEPTAGLDPAHALALFSLLSRLAASGHTIIIALHDLSLAARFCHDVVMLKDGILIASGPAETVLVAEHLDRAFAARMGIGNIAGQPAIIPLAPEG
ncbi:MAG: ABC transporter ATP-binding protein [Hyphomicrobiaceae bacterium]